MMHAMRPDDAANDAEAKQEPHGQAPVAEAVVHDEVPEAEGAHAEAGAERELARDARGRDAAPHDERDRRGHVEEGERVVRLEPRAFRAGRVVGAMNRPEPPVPDRAVEERCPQLHAKRDDQRRRRPDERVPQRRRAHAEAALRWESA